MRVRIFYDAAMRDWYFPQDQAVCGTITQQIGNPAFKHGYKILYEEEDAGIR